MDNNPITKVEFDEICKRIQDCQRFLGVDDLFRTPKNEVEKIAVYAARREILTRLDYLYERLDRAGLTLIDEQV